MLTLGTPLSKHPPQYSVLGLLPGEWNCLIPKFLDFNPEVLLILAIECSLYQLACLSTDIPYCSLVSQVVHHILLMPLHVHPLPYSQSDMFRIQI